MQVNARYWASRLVIPIIMIVIAARAVYLNHAYDLSTWKGGGMGMFAGADNSATRFSLVFIEGPDGQRYPLLRLTKKQQLLIQSAHLYPRRENFIPVANDIRATKWASAGMARETRLYDSKGDLIRKGPEKYELLTPFGDRAPGDKTNFTVIFENFQMQYSVPDSTLSAKAMNTFRFETAE